MKTNLLVCALLSVALLGSNAAQAQTPRPGRVAPKPRVVASTTEGTKDGLSMKDGRVILTELGISNPLVGNKKLINGTIISPAGVVMARDSTKSQMSEGDHVSLTGRITSRASILAADSIAKVQLFDALNPGKRKKMEEAAEKKAKAKAKVADAKAKVAEDRAKAKAKVAEERAKAKEKAAKRNK